MAQENMKMPCLLVMRNKNTIKTVMSNHFVRIKYLFKLSGLIIDLTEFVEKRLKGYTPFATFVKNSIKVKNFSFGP
jgi:hypothetical protein